jgi:hypothetical protein
VDYDCDQLITCQCCGITVHQFCYGVGDLPPANTNWICKACEKRQEVRLEHASSPVFSTVDRVF